jgi:hypothetical protein
MKDVVPAIIGLIGVVIGGVIQFVVQYLQDQRQTKSQRELDTKRKDLLKTALENPPPGKEWRQLDTLSRIVGADYETTTRLLIELGARGSETEEEVWALISKKPLRH